LLPPNPDKPEKKRSRARRNGAKLKAMKQKAKDIMSDVGIKKLNDHSSFGTPLYHWISED